MIEPILIVGIAIALTAWYVQHKWRRRIRDRAIRNSTGLELLAKRYACGDIDRAEYLQKRADILGPETTSPSRP